jgi:anti-sigma factor RsiW
MNSCREVEPLFAPYVDGDVAPADRARIDAHLQACPPCRDRVTSEQAAREAVHTCAARLRGCAPGDLRRRCEALRHDPPAVRPWRRAWVPLSMAAALVLAAAGVFLWGAAGGVDTYAAQLAVDHKTCFLMAPAAARADAAQVARDLEASTGWRLRIPESAAGHGLELLGARRCLSGEGRTAHVLYRWRGEPVSLYVLNDRIDSVPDAATRFVSVDRLGERTIMWTGGQRTYALVTDTRHADVMPLANYVRKTVE